MVRYRPNNTGTSSRIGDVVSEFQGGRGTKDLILSANDSELSFRPRYLPKRIKVSRERELDRQTNFCKSEEVSDTGAKNKEIHINGEMRDPATDVFDAVLDYGGRFTLICSSGTYRVKVETGDYSGPVGMDSKSRHNLWEYTIDLVADPIKQNDTGPGIVDDAGRDPDPVIDPFAPFGEQ